MAQPRVRNPVPRTARTSRVAFEALEADFRRRMDGLGEALSSGRIELDAWQDAMRAELRRYHLATSVLGAGGANQVVARNFRIAESAAARQIAYLDQWADDMRRGTFPLDAAPRVRQRARLYAGAANATFAESRQQRYGLPSLDHYPGDGTHICKSNCRCFLEYQQVEDGFDIYWRTTPRAEHCPDCEAMARRWSPLRVRGGVLVNSE